jgi:hypothetical protein
MVNNSGDAGDISWLQFENIDAASSSVIRLFNRNVINLDQAEKLIHDFGKGSSEDLQAGVDLLKRLPEKQLKNGQYSQAKELMGLLCLCGLLEESAQSELLQKIDAIHTSLGATTEAQELIDKLLNDEFTDHEGRALPVTKEQIAALMKSAKENYKPAFIALKKLLLVAKPKLKCEFLQQIMPIVLSTYVSPAISSQFSEIIDVLVFEESKEVLYRAARLRYALLERSVYCTHTVQGSAELHLQRIKELRVAKVDIDEKIRQLECLLAYVYAYENNLDGDTPISEVLAEAIASIIPVYTSLIKRMSLPASIAIVSLSTFMLKRNICVVDLFKPELVDAFKDIYTAVRVAILKEERVIEPYMSKANHMVFEGLDLVGRLGNTDAEIDFKLEFLSYICDVHMNTCNFFDLDEMLPGIQKKWVQSIKFSLDEVILRKEVTNRTQQQAFNCMNTILRAGGYQPEWLAQNFVDQLISWAGDSNFHARSSVLSILEMLIRHADWKKENTSQTLINAMEDALYDKRPNCRIHSAKVICNAAVLRSFNKEWVTDRLVEGLLELFGNSDSSAQYRATRALMGLQLLDALKPGIITEQMLATMLEIAKEKKEEDLLFAINIYNAGSRFTGFNNG